MKFLNLFRGKSKVDLEQLVNGYHLAQISEPVILGIPISPNDWRAVFEYIKVVDPSLGKVNKNIFVQEMIALTLELFGLAWIHHIQSEKPCIREAMFTKAFLEENKLKKIWSAMSLYNRAIARAYEAMPAVVETDKRVLQPLASEAKVYQSSKKFNRNLRQNFLKQYTIEGFDSACVKRIAYRLGTEDGLQGRPLFEILAEVFTQCIKCNLNVEGKFRIRCIAEGLYKSAQETIRSVDVDYHPYSVKYPIDNTSVGE